MTDNAEIPLPDTVDVSDAFARRMPTQRVIDAVEQIEGVRFGDLLQRQPMRVVAFRALMRDYAGRDMTSLWLHSYDVEVSVVEADPTNGSSPTLVPSFDGSGVATLTP